MTAHGRLIGAWTTALVAGWLAVALLGGPVATAADDLGAALHPATPVTEAIARTSAATIIRLQYQELTALEPTVTHATDFGGDRWVLVYARSNPVSGVRVSIDTVRGVVRLTNFP